MSAEQLVVNPAIVHAMRCKEAMGKANQAKPSMTRNLRQLLAQHWF